MLHSSFVCLPTSTPPLTPWLGYFIMANWKKIVTHAPDFSARIVIQKALFTGRAKASLLIIPWSTNTSPEIADVGLYEKDAKEKGTEADTFTQELNKVDH